MHLRPAVLSMFLFASTVHAQGIDTVALARDIPRLMEVGGVPGLSIAVVEDGRILWTGAFGTLNATTDAPVNERTVFGAASLSKPVFAYAVMRLASRGEFDIDRPLAEILEYPRLAHDERYKRITARMVLSHGTGLPNWGGDRLSLRFDPGTGFDYSGEGYLYLQKVLEKVTGLSLEDLARREVFEPIGMTHSSYVWQERFAGNAVEGKDWAWREAGIRRTEANAAFTLVTTATDFARFIIAVLDGTGLPSEHAAAMITPARSAHRPWKVMEADPHVFWALGWGIQEGRAGRAFWQWGDNGASQAYAIGFPERSSGLVYFANSHDGLAIAEPIVSLLARDDHWALQWIDYARHDDPRWLAIKAVQRAAVTEGAEAALAVYHASRADTMAKLPPAAAGDLARFLATRGLPAASRRVLEIAIEDFPDSTRIHDLLGPTLLEAADYTGALETYRQALAMDPNDQDVLRHIEWIEQRRAVVARPVDVPVSTLRTYAGAYGTRRVRFSEGTLYYQREGSPEFALTPLSDTLFALQGNETLRVRFGGDGRQPASAIMEIELNGNTDEVLRSGGG